MGMRYNAFRIAVLLMAQVAFAASFDCAKAKTAVEKAVCAQEEISSLDSAMGSLYGALRKGLDSTGRAILKKDQSMWLKRRDAAFTAEGADGLSKWYRERVAILRKRAEFDKRKTVPDSVSYQIVHEMEYFNGEEVTIELVSDEYTIKRKSATELEFSIYVMGNNAHSCEVGGVAKADGTTFTWRSDDPDDNCAIVIRFEGNRVVFDIDEDTSCRSFCGMRAWIYDRTVGPAQLAP